MEGFKTFNPFTTIFCHMKKTTDGSEPYCNQLGVKINIAQLLLFLIAFGRNEFFKTVKTLIIVIMY